MSENYRMFQNPILEKLSATNPPMMITYHLIVASSIMAYALYHQYLTAPTIALAFLAGFAFWTFGEYVLHRWLFHFINDWKVVKAFHHAVHGYHHDHPRDSKRLFMPPVPATLLLLAFFGLFYIFLRQYTWGFLPGFELGYLMYSLVHYSVHTRKPPKRFKHLWIHHSLHHHQYPNLAFGVSNTFWDKIFNTMPPRVHYTVSE